MRLTSQVGVAERVAGFAVDVIYPDGTRDVIRCGPQFNLFSPGDTVVVVRNRRGECVRLIHQRKGLMVRLIGGHTLLSAFSTARVLLATVPGAGVLVAWDYWRHWLRRWGEGDRTLAVMTSLVVVGISALGVVLPMLVSNASAGTMSAEQASSQALLWPLLAAAFWPGIYMLFEAVVDAARTHYIDHQAWQLEADHDAD